MRGFLGIDLGLSGAKAAVVDRNGRLLGTGRSEVARLTAGAGEQEPEEWLAAVAAAVGRALDAAGNPAIEAIGIGALGPCLVTVTKDLQPIGRASLFSLDRRAEPCRRRLIEEGHDETLIGPDHVLPKLIWLEQTDLDRFGRTDLVLDATGFLVGSLTGSPVIDPITACDHLLPGIEPLRPLPPIRKADELAGLVTAAAARRFGLTTGTPVCVGSYDSYVDLFGSGVSQIGDAGMLLGTTLVMGKVVGEGACGPDLRLSPHIGKGLFLGGWTSSAGSLLDWSASLLGEAAVAAAAASRPGKAGIVMLPYFAGERAPVWDPLARGVILGPTLESSAGDIHRAAIDAVALSAMDIARRMGEWGAATESFRVSGGGARNTALVEALAHSTGATLEIVAHPGEATAPAILAAHAAGLTITPGIEREVEPDDASSEIYDRLLETYRPLYCRLKEAMHEMGRLAAALEAR
jgi:xylulokinase